MSKLKIIKQEFDPYKFIEKNGIFTGSRAFKCDTAKSDFDFFMEMYKYNTLRDFCIENEMVIKEIEENEYSKGAAGIYIKHRLLFDIEINIIGLDEENFQAWSFANHIFLDVLKKDFILSMEKKLRKDFFRNLVESFLKIKKII